jgi:chromosome segregation ATPase
MTDEAAVTDGKPPAKVEVQRPLKEARRGQIEAGLRAYQEAAQEVEELKAEIDRQRRDLLARDMEIASLKERADQMMDAHAQQLTLLESRVHDCQSVRDQAVAEKVALETILSSMRSIFRLAPIPEERPAGNGK